MFRRSKGPPAPRRSFVGRPHSLRAQVQQRELPHADPIDPHRGPVATSVLVEQPGEQGRRTEQRQRIDDQYPDERMQVDLRRAEFQTVLASVKDGSARSDLCLKGMFLSILQIQELAGALQACGGKGKDTILYDLNLPDNFIKDEGMAVIAAMLKENTTINVLDLSHNLVTAEGAKNLAAALATNTTLEELYIGNNHLGDEGIKHICSALQKNRGTRLKTLYIYKNAITDEGLQAVADLVQSNTSLTDIVAYHNNFSEKAVDAFIPALEVNHSLLRVDLYFGGWRVIPRTDVDAILNRNKRWKTQNSKFWYQLAPLIAVLGRVGDQNSESSLKNSVRFSSILHLVRAFLVGAPASPMASSEHICVDVALGMNGKALDIFLASSFMRSIEGATDQLSLKRKHGAV